MDFLLECIGFPPSHDYDDLANEALVRGEPVAWRGPDGVHKSLALGSGLEVHVDREPGDPRCSIWPYFRARESFRIRVESLRAQIDSPCDAVLVGWTGLASEGPWAGSDVGLCRLSALLTDARRLPRRVPAGHVLAVALGGFAVHVESILAPSPEAAALPARFEPLAGPEEPGGCVDLSATITAVTRLENPLTGAAVQRIDVRGPGRSLALFASPWQLFEDGLPAPEVGGRIEGSFLLSGRVTGGLPSVRERVGACFG